MTRSIPTLTPQEMARDDRSRRAGVTGARGWFAVPGALATLLVAQADAQEIPRPSYARQKEKASLPTVSNFRVGEVLLRVDAQMTTNFTDNVDLSNTPKADLSVNPEIDLNATWAVTKLNTLRFRAALGYNYFLNSPKLNRTTATISPDSALSFDVYAGDVKVNFHDQFSLQEETYNQGSLSGVAQLLRFTNTAGFSILWDTNDVVWNLGYDHFNFITLGGANSSAGTTAANISKLDHSTEQLSASVAIKLSSVLIGGIEGTVAYSDYPEQPDSNFSQVSVGPYFEFQLTQFTHVFFSGGYKGVFSGANAAGSVSVDSSVAARPSTGDPAGFYGSLAFAHRLNRYYSDRLEFAHTDEVEALSGHVQTNSVKYSGSWRLNTKFSLSPSLYFEDVRIIAGSAISGSVSGNYSRVGGSVGTNYRISPHVDAAFSYSYAKKMSERATESYAVNRVTISLGYRF